LTRLRVEGEMVKKVERLLGKIDAWRRDRDMGIEGLVYRARKESEEAETRHRRWIDEYEHWTRRCDGV